MLDAPVARLTTAPTAAVTEVVLAEPLLGAPVSHAARWRRSVGALALATMGIGLANYVTSLVAAHLLPAAQFEDFAAGQGLLLVLGTGSLAALPWAVARYLARSEATDDAQRAREAGEAMHFGLLGALLQGLVLAPVALVVCWGLDGPLFGLAGGLATLMISVLAGPTGFLQGRHELNAIAAMRAMETVVRVGVTMLLLLVVSRSAAVVLFAFPVAGVVALGFALRCGRDGFPLHRVGRGVAMRLTREAALLGAIQVLLAMLGALDTVYAAAGHFTADQGASYQAAALLARIPLFLSAAVSTAAYTHLAAAPDEDEAGRQLRTALRTYLWLAVPFVVGYLTMPAAVLDLVVPPQFHQTLPVLRAICLAGVLVGAINVLTTGHQARGGFRSCIAILVGAVVVQGVALWAVARTGHLVTFAVVETLVCAATAVALAHDARRWWHGARIGSALTPVDLGVRVALVVATVVACIDHRPAVWIPALLVVGAGALMTAFTHRDDAAAHPPQSPRIEPITEEIR